MFEQWALAEVLLAAAGVAVVGTGAFYFALLRDAAAAERASRREQAAFDAMVLEHARKQA